MGLQADINPILSCIQADTNLASTFSFVQVDSGVNFSTNCSYPETSVPDAAFENYLETHDRDGNIVAITDPSNMGNGTANDAKVFTHRINTVTQLVVDNVGITLLTGLEDFRDLELFNAFGGNPALTSVDLSNNLKLDKVSIVLNSAVNSLVFGSLPNLTWIQVGYDNVTNIDISGLPSLKEFRHFSGQLTSLDTSGNPDLELLSLQSTSITALDLSSNLKLKTLSVAGSLTDLNLSNNVLLTSLSVAGNQLTGLNINNGANQLINTASFNITNNPSLTCIEVSDVAYATVNWTNIDTQHMFNTICIAPRTLTPDVNFEQALIDLGHDDVIDGSILTASISGLTSLDVSDPLNNGNLPNVTAKIVDLTGIEDFVALETLRTHGNNLSAINVSTNIALKELLVYNNSLSSINVISNLLLEVLYIDANQISNIDVSQNLALKEFYCSSNLLTALDVSKNINLIKLNPSGNQIKILDVSKNLLLTHLNTSLKLLQCNNNNLKTLNIANGNNTNMALWAHANPVLTCIQADSNTGPPAGDTQIDSQTSFNTNCSYPETNVPDTVFENYLETHDRDGNVVTLGHITSMGNGIANDAKVFTHRICSVTELYPTNIDIGILTGLEDFIALEEFGILSGNNSLTTADFSANIKLKRITLQNTPTLTSIIFGNLPDVTYLNIHNNGLTSIDVLGLPKLEEFRCGANPLSTLNITQNLNLKFLHCQNTLFSTLDTSQNVDLESLVSIDSKLVSLDFTNNQALKGITTYNTPTLTTISLPNNPNLTYVDAHHTGITSLDLSNSPLVSTLDLYDTGLVSLNLDSNPAIVYLLVYNNSQMTSLSIKNGNNSGISGGLFATLNNPLLTCVEVSDVNYATTNWTQIDSQHTFSANCNLNCTADTNSTQEDTPLSVTSTNGLLANDTGSTLTVSQIAIGTTTYTVGTLFTITEGDITINTDGSYTFSPATGFNGSVPQITYTLSDGTSTTICTLDITVTPTPVNVAPVAVDDTITGITVNLITANDTDVDGTIDAATVVLIDPNNVSNTGNSSMPLIISGIGTFTIDTLGNVTFTADAGFTGNSIIVNYTVNDNDGLISNTALITFSLNTCTILPVILESGFEPNTLAGGTGNGIGSWTVTGQTPIQFTSSPVHDGVRAAKFPSDGSRFAYQEISVTPNANYVLKYWYTLKNSTTGSVTTSILPSGSHTNLTSALTTPIAAFIGTDQIDPTTYVQVSLPFNSGSNSTIAIHVTNQSVEARVDLISIELGQGTSSCNLNCTADTNSTQEDTPLSVTSTNGLLANDTGSTLTVSQIAIGTTTYTVGTLFTITEGDITINTDGSYTFNPAADFNGSVPQITYTLSDGTSTTTCTLDITVTPVNDPPVAVDDTISGTSGNPITANDTDVDGTIDSITIILIDPNNTANIGDSSTPLVISSVGTFTIDVTGNVYFTADSSFTGTSTTINYTVNDNDGLTSNTAIITINISSQAITLIPDSNFENILVARNIDTDGVVNGQVFTADINTITSLLMVGTSILDMTGIEDFVALQNLDVSSNQISNLDLSNNTNLTGLSCNNNQIISLNISQNTNLTSLSCNSNLLTTIDLTKNLALEYLHLDDNSIKNLDLSSHSQLRTVRLYNNNLESLDIRNGNNSILLTYSTKLNSGLYCVAVDNVSHFNNNFNIGGIWLDSQTSFNTDCSAIWTINTNTTTSAALLAITGLDANNDGDITLAEAAAYTGTLDLSGQSLTDVEGLQAFTNVTVIDLQNNNISDFSPLTDAMISIISKSTGEIKTQARTVAFNLEELLISNNTAVESLDVSKLTKLTKLIIKDNPNLTTVSVKNGNNALITEFDSSNTPKLTCIIVDDINAGYLSTWTKDAANTFVADEADCRARVLSISEESLSTSISFYPNPVKDFLTINLSNQLELKEIEIINLIGKKVLASKEEKINLYTLTSGVYLLKIVTNKGIVTRKIIKE